MTILSKILDRARIVGKIQIFILDMSTVVKNDTFEQNLGSGQHFFRKIKIFILDMSAVIKNDNFEPDP